MALTCQGWGLAAEGPSPAENSSPGIVRCEPVTNGCNQKGPVSGQEVWAWEAPPTRTAGRCISSPQDPLVPRRMLIYTVTLCPGSQAKALQDPLAIVPRPAHPYHPPSLTSRKVRGPGPGGSRLTQ